MPINLEALEKQAKVATERFLRHRSTMAIENAIELALTHMSVAEVKEVLRKQAEFLEEFG
ncbi:hypothetical protein [Mesorhizobium sp. M8A.F.Ca.ET.021.01.1.1]|uniref:hypothetical protein n=1 Tax=Mesorhizobium sp. M8A.F.Ca.ET.021.01.1.1 TaxID=2496757 RepID=UPI000FCAFBAE|nr:hypothetical protein [Mesorhizobium sp. M8A.F.Ca.ET.021.01.1.1]RUW56720.1 hypothetical protein EOA36_02735 [Mesorhizobium sp. M8A.F.Ca.ET.021.01.1.1]